MDLCAVHGVAELGQAIRELAVTRLVPIAEEFGERSEVCRPLVRKIGSAGLFGVLTAGEEYPWLAANRWTAHSVIREALALEDSQCEEVYTIQGLGLYPISYMGNPEQKERFLPAVLSGERLSAFALTEPEAGSDTKAMKTTAARSRDGWVLNGEKTFISHAPDADVYVVFARLASAEGVSAFIVEKDTPGFEREASLELASPHAIGTLRFHDCVVPHENLLGPEGRGLRVALKALEVFRPSVGARAIGLSRRGLKFATEWAQRRIVFGQPLITQQAVSFTLAEMAMRIHTARSVVYDAARRADRGDSVSFEGSVAKAVATETAQSVAYQAQQIFGGRGVLVGNPAEQLARQVRAMTIYEGTSEVLRVIIGRHVARGTYADAWEF